MKHLFPIAALALAGAVPAAAQSVPDDVRCLVVSDAFAKAAKDPRGREAAGITAAFYLGRVDGRASAAAVKAAIPEQTKVLKASNAGQVMNACVARAARADAFLRSLARQVAPAQ